MTMEQKLHKLSRNPNVKSVTLTYEQTLPLGKQYRIVVGFSCFAALQTEAQSFSDACNNIMEVMGIDQEGRPDSND